MGSSCCLQDKRGEERTPIAGPNIKEATGRLERQKESLEESIEKLRQDLENSRDEKQKISLQKRIISRQNSLQGVNRQLSQLKGAKSGAGKNPRRLPQQQTNKSYGTSVPRQGGGAGDTPL